jgi:hypothetical protein
MHVRSSPDTRSTHAHLHKRELLIQVCLLLCQPVGKLLLHGDAQPLPAAQCLGPVSVQTAGGAGKQRPSVQHRLPQAQGLLACFTAPQVAHLQALRMRIRLCLVCSSCVGRAVCVRAKQYGSSS